MSAVIYAQAGRVVTLTLNRPDTRNALSADVVDAILEKRPAQFSGRE